MKKLFLFLLLPAAGAMAQQAALPLNLKSAVELALAPDGNTRSLLATEMVKQAEARSHEARSALLLNADGNFGFQNQTRNLAAFGIQLNIPIPGFQFPEMVGPYNTMDARASATQSLFDLSAIRRYQASKVGVHAAKAENDTAHNQTVNQVAKAYLNALRTKASLEAAQADVELARALLRLAESQKKAGTGTGIEIVRADVQLADQRQRLLVAETNSTRARLELLRAIGLPLDRPVELAGQLRFEPVEDPSIAASLATARQTRPDLKAQDYREQNARLSYSATKLERLPSVNAFADYGAIGTSMDNMLATRTYGVSVKVPIFDGGRRDARRAESLSLYRQESVRTRDTRQQVELEVREAIDSLQSAAKQVETAEEGLKLSGRELEQAERRYKAGVTNSIEVIDAQTRLERARDNRIVALFNYGLARIDLETARGTVEKLLQ